MNFKQRFLKTLNMKNLIWWQHNNNFAWRNDSIRSLSSQGCKWTPPPRRSLWDHHLLKKIRS